MKKLIILDGNALLHRAYHAIQPLTDPKGRVVNAVYGFARVLVKILKEMKPDYMAVCWDRKEKTFRHEAYAEYKAHREKKPDELYEQIPIIQDLLSAYQIPSYDKIGYEADDLIGTIAKKMKSKVDQVIIVTGDKDAFQLVDDKINVLTFKKGVSETELYDEAAVRERYGLSPKQMIDYKALMGDPSDNIKGVRGIGKKGAQKLIAEYGDIDKLYKALENGALAASEKIKTALAAGKKDAEQSRKLVKIEQDIPMEISLDEIKFGDYDAEKVRDFFVACGFRTMLAEQTNQQPAVGSQQSAVKEIHDLEQAKKIISYVKENDELIFYISEMREGLFGKEIEAVWLAFGGRMIKFLPGKNLKARDLLKALSLVFENDKIKKISHDIKNQMYILDKFGVALKGVYFDAMIAAYILNPGTRGYDLERLALDFLKKELGKNLIFEILNLKNLLAERLAAEKMERVFFEIEMPLVPVLFRVERNGIKVDKKMLLELSADFEKRLAEIDKKISKLAGQEFNIDSPQQLKVVLYDKLGLRPESGRIKRGKTGLSTAASELEKLAGRHPIIDFISEHRELAKLKNTYVDALPKLLDKNSRVHTSFNQTVTSTGRLSSSNPNLQNIPVRTELGKKIREAFIADEGSVLVSLDYSQIELRLAAALSGELHMIDAFAAGEDIHRQTAAEIFGVPEKDVTKEMRSAAKAINFGVLYGMGAAGLAAATKMSRREAEDFLRKYYEAHPAIVDYVERTKALAYKTGYVETLFGRRRYLPEIKSHIPQLQAAAERMAINMPVQGTAADIIKMAMVEIDKNIASNDVKMVLQVHDELIFEIKKGKEKKATQEIKEAMENIYKLKVPLTAEAEVGERWE